MRRIRKKKYNEVVEDSFYDNLVYALDKLKLFFDVSLKNIRILIRPTCTDSIGRIHLKKNKECIMLIQYKRMINEKHI